MTKSAEIKNTALTLIPNLSGKLLINYAILHSTTEKSDISDMI